MQSTKNLLESKIIISKDIVSRPVQKEEVILHLESGTYFGLNQVGTQIWELIKKGTPVKKIITTLVQDYQIGKQKAETDVLSLLKVLKKNNLISFQ
ncbi:MAG: PqqD family protein [Oligoflexia bacterium]|nr:PqqD family protein [Oligoflexia bacterium]